MYTELAIKQYFMGSSTIRINNGFKHEEFPAAPSYVMSMCLTINNTHPLWVAHIQGHSSRDCPDLGCNPDGRME